jgi:hypothetical protein
MSVKEVPCTNNSGHRHSEDVSGNKPRPNPHKYGAKGQPAGIWPDDPVIVAEVTDEEQVKDEGEKRK